MIKFLCFVVLAQICIAVKLNNFKVKWGDIPFISTSFRSTLPRVQADAKDFDLINGTQCDNGKFVGVRMWKNNDPSLVLIYDMNGIIAGIQSGIPKSEASKGETYYPFSKKPTYQQDSLGGQDVYIATVYFIPPNSICGSGRTKKDLDVGTLEGVYIQNGSNPRTDFIKQVTIEKDMYTTSWSKEKCFLSMGRHYFYDIKDDMQCSETFNYFLLFNHGELTGMGFVHPGNYEGEHYEHPPLSAIGLFFDKPACFENFFNNQVGGMTTMHVFFNTNPLNLSC